MRQIKKDFENKKTATTEEHSTQEKLKRNQIYRYRQTSENVIVCRGFFRMINEADS